jgi:glycerol kinase
LAEISKQWQTDRRFVPSLKTTDRKKLLVGWTKALARARHWSED